MKNLFNKHKRLGIPWRFILTALLVIAQIIFSILVLYYAESQYFWVKLLISVVWLIFLFVAVNRDEPASYKLPWVIVILIFPIAGAVLFLIFGKPKLSLKAQRRFNKVNPKRSQFLTQSPETENLLKNLTADGLSVSKYLLSTARTPVFGNTKSEFLSDGQTFFDSLFEDIKNAKEYVFLEYFIIREGEIFSKLYQLLLQKVSEGVAVYMIYDDMGSMKYLPIDFDVKLRKKGINCFKFNPFYPVVSIVHNNRDHRKIAVIDGKVAYTGGINIGDEYANIQKPFGLWKDCGVKIKGSAVDTFCVMFIENYNSTCFKPLDASKFLRPHEQEIFDGFVQPFGDGPRPVDEDYIGQSLYLNMIYSAKKYLYIATPYFIVDSSFLDALDSCAKRGVDVRILTPHIPDKKAVFTLTRSYYERLIKSGVKVYEYKSGFVHSKTLLCDDIMAVVGTINFDYRSFVHHYECGVVLYGSKCLGDIKSDYLKTVEQNGIEQTLKSAKLTLGEKFIKNLLGLFAPLL